MLLLKELSRTSQDSLESDSDSKESRDIRLNSFKSGILRFFDSIDSIFISIRSILRPSVVVDRPGRMFDKRCTKKKKPAGPLTDARLTSNTRPTDVCQTSDGRPSD